MIITVLGSTVIIIILSTMWYLKYCKATGKARYLFT